MESDLIRGNQGTNFLEIALTMLQFAQIGDQFPDKMRLNSSIIRIYLEISIFGVIYPHLRAENKFESSL